MTKRTVKFFMSKGGLTIFNFILLAVFSFSMFNAFTLLFNQADDAVQMDNIMNAIATILVAYGVVLEERESIFKIAKIYPAAASETESNLDHLCHDYGISFLVIGLFIEVTTEIVKIPCQIINFSAVEKPIFAVGMSLCVASIFMLLYFTMKIFFSGKEKNGESELTAA